MFTGIIEELGKVKSISKNAKESRIYIDCSKVLEDVCVGDSIAVNGVCLTVVDYSSDGFSADVMNETFNRSSLGRLRSGSTVDLERAMAANGRFGGHIVSGHIDGTGKILGIKNDGNAVWFEIETSREILNGIVKKGSIAIDGISLTVAGVMKKSFSVSIIPHTLSQTVLGEKRVGDVVNLENDVIGKYVARFLGKRDAGGLSMEALLENGF